MQENPEIEISSANALVMNIPASGWQGEGGAVAREEEPVLKPAKETASEPHGGKEDFYHRVAQACLALITAGLVLIGVATAGFFWNRQSRELAPGVSAPSASLAQAPAGVEAIPLNSAPALNQAVRGNAGSSLPMATPRVLTGAEVDGLVSGLRNGPVPRDCESAVRQLVAERNVIVRQAQQIAKQAYPELCAPGVQASVPVAVSPDKLSQAVGSSANVDALYQVRVKAECSANGFDHFCTNRIRQSLCEGLYSSDPPPGQIVCKK